jgi:hypothetical protein
MIPIPPQIGDMRSHILKLLSQQLDQFVSIASCSAGSGGGVAPGMNCSAGSICH